jgi:hypothetical protein
MQRTFQARFPAYILPRIIFVNMQRFQVADDDGHRNSSLLTMNWVAVNVQPANEDHRLSKPEYVHVWISPGRWFNMPQVPVCFCRRERVRTSSCVQYELHFVS